ncbi:MAG: hypothetical protein LIP28_04200 [Deltaproteobacteria bacterium]|nr:hypothetical protein [Deltaproteobacteria bacterium]
MFMYSFSQRKYIYPALMFLFLILFLMRFAVAVDSAPRNPHEIERARNAIHNADAAARDATRRTENRTARDTDSALNDIRDNVSRDYHRAEDALSRDYHRTGDALTRDHDRVRETTHRERVRETAHRDYDRGLRRDTADTHGSIRYGRSDETPLERAVERREDQIRTTYHKTQAEHINDWHRLHGNAYDGRDQQIDFERLNKYYEGNPVFFAEEDIYTVRPTRTVDSRYASERETLRNKWTAEQKEYREKRREIENRLSNTTRNSADYTSLQSQLTDLERRFTRAEREYERDFRNLDARYADGKR